MNSERTQIKRKNVSAPTRWILGHVDLHYKFVLHHGEGKAFQDTEAMLDAGAFVAAYDPNTEANNHSLLERDHDIAISNYVFNTLTYHERVAAWNELLACADRALVSVRTDTSSIFNNGWMPQGDGWITNRGTFQCIQSAEWWTHWFLMNSPKRTSVSVLHDGGHFVILDVWR